MNTQEIDPNYKRPIDNQVATPAIWLDETAHDMISAMSKAQELIKTEKYVEAFYLIESQKHYWAGIRDGNRFMKNPFIAK